MTYIDCERFDELLDLYAADECDPGSASVMRAHLDDCPRCQAALRHAQEMLGLLDLHFREEQALNRLSDELRRQARRDRVRATHLPFVRRLTALAALLLVCLGMGLWLEPGQVSPLSLPVSLEVAATPVRDPGIRMAPARVPEAKIVLGKEPAKVIKLQARSLQDWRQEIRAGYRTGKLPWPPRAPIELTINNTGSRPLHVRLGGESFACQLDLSGGAVRRVPARGKDIFTPSIPAKLTIPPGQQETLRWERLVEVHGSRVTYLYPLSAGEYTLSVRLRVEAWEQNEFPRTLWLNAASGVTVNVVEPK